MNPWLTLAGGLATIALLPVIHGIVNRAAGTAVGFFRTIFIACAAVVLCATGVAAAVGSGEPRGAVAAACWQAVLSGSLAACYAVTVLGLRETSPSVRILQLLRNAKPEGRTVADIVHCLSDSSTVTDRILGADALGVVSREGGRIALTRRGAVVARGLRLVQRAFRV